MRKTGRLEKDTIGERIFYAFNYVILALAGLLSVYPFIYVLSASISSKEAVNAGRVVLFPIDISLKAYEMVLSKQEIWMAYGNTIYFTVAGTLVSLILTTFGAYPLSKKTLVGRTTISQRNRQIRLRY